jgi:hypothetical protein
MKYVKLLVVALGAMFALGVATAASSSALTLPDVSIALGGSYPLHLEVTNLTVKSKLSNPVEALEGVGLLILFLTEQLTSLGTFEVLFTKVQTAAKVSCASEGDTNGEVLTKGTFHIVPVGGGKVDTLYLVANFKVNCGSKSIKVQGSVLQSISSLTGTEGTEYSSLSGAKITGNGAGKPTLTTYLTDSEAVATAKLESNFGSGFKESAEEVEEPVTATALEGKMFTIAPL